MLQKIWNRMKETLFKVHHSGVLGVFVADKEIFLAEAAVSPRGIELLRTAAVKIPVLEAADDAELFLGSLIQKGCGTEGMESRYAIVCLDQQAVFSCKEKFPLMKHDELTEALRWDIDDIIPFGEEPYFYGFKQVSQKNEMVEVEIEAVRQERVKALRRSLQEIGTELLAIVRRESVSMESEAASIRMVFADAEETLRLGPDVLPEEVSTPGCLAAIQAVCYMSRKEKMVNLLPPELQAERFGWTRLCGWVAAVLLVLLCSIYVGGWLQLRGLQAAAGEEKAKLELLQESIDRRRDLEAKEQVIEQKNAVLAALSKETISWQGIMTHLGFLTVDGVKLIDVQFNGNDELVLTGEAVDYMLLADFLAKFERDELFKQAALVGSEKKTAAGSMQPVVTFTVKVNLRKG